MSLLVLSIKGPAVQITESVYTMIYRQIPKILIMRCKTQLIKLIKTQFVYHTVYSALFFILIIIILLRTSHSSPLHLIAGVTNY